MDKFEEWLEKVGSKKIYAENVGIGTIARKHRELCILSEQHLISTATERARLQGKSCKRRRKRRRWDRWLK